MIAVSSYCIGRTYNGICSELSISPPRFRTWAFDRPQITFNAIFCFSKFSDWISWFSFPIWISTFFGICLGPSLFGYNGHASKTRDLKSRIEFNTRAPNDVLSLVSTLDHSTLSLLQALRSFASCIFNNLSSASGLLDRRLKVY
jgi:hypothetical protein